MNSTDRQRQTLTSAFKTNELYDRRGRPATIAAGGLTTTLAYNNASQLLSETYSGGVLNGLAMTNAYDAYLRRSAVALKTQPATLTQFGYDLAGRLQGVTNGSYRAAYTYLANAPLVSQITFRSNTVTRMTTSKRYDFLNRLTDIQSSTGGAPVAHSAYAYNTANQRTAITNADNARWVYTYDALGQVTSGKKYWSDGTPVAGQQFEYAFDDIGNRKNTKVGGDENGANLRPANYTNNALNQITSRGVPGYVEVLGLALVTNTVTVNGQSTYRKGEYFRKELTVNNSSVLVWQSVSVAAAGEATVAGNVLVARTPQAFTYDFDGNLTSDGLWTNTWNAENRLLKTESLSSVPAAARAREEWTYLPDGRWIQRIVSTNSGAAYYPAYTNRYVWDGQVLLAILDHTNGLVMSFMRGLDPSGTLQGAGGVGGVLAVSFKTNGAHFCAYDGNGNVTALASAANGSASARYEYGPFGETIRMTGPVATLNPIRFSTQYADDVTGNVKYLYRDYNPSTGRWMSRDPILERGGRNLYRFARNDPVNFIDQLGLCAADCTAGCNRAGCEVRVVPAGYSPGSYKTIEELAVLYHQTHYFGLFVASAMTGAASLCSLEEGIATGMGHAAGHVLMRPGQAIAKVAPKLLDRFGHHIGWMPFVKVSYQTCVKRCKLGQRVHANNGYWKDLAGSKDWEPVKGDLPITEGFTSVEEALKAGLKKCDEKTATFREKNKICN